MILKKVYNILEERCLTFVDCHEKTGGGIAVLICQTLKDYEIPLIDYRGQGYNKGSNLSDKYKGAQSCIFVRMNMQYICFLELVGAI